MKKIKTEDKFELLRKLDKNNYLPQREIAEKLGFSLGKINYCLRELKKKGFVKIRNFQKQENKIKYFRSYILTSKGISERTNLTINFMKRKMKEYDELKKELEKK